MLPPGAPPDKLFEPEVASEWHAREPRHNSPQAREPCRAIRYGDPAKYDRSYDGLTNVRGGSWMDTVTRAQKIDPKASEFRSADIPFVLLEELQNKKGDTTLAEAGHRLGHSLSVTGWKSFQTFIKGCQRAGIDIRSGAIKCTLTYEVRKNAKGEWGVLSFRDAEEISLEDAAE